MKIIKRLGEWHKRTLEESDLYKAVLIVVLLLLAILCIRELVIINKQAISGCTGNINYDNATICYKGLLGL